jgi:hypothetical protein
MNRSRISPYSHLTFWKFHMAPLGVCTMLLAIFLLGCASNLAVWSTSSDTASSVVINRRIQPICTIHSPRFATPLVLWKMCWTLQSFQLVLFHHMRKTLNFFGSTAVSHECRPSVETRLLMVLHLKTSGGLSPLVPGFIHRSRCIGIGPEPICYRRRQRTHEGQVKGARKRTKTLTTFLSRYGGP